jgi:hypothetical protein
MVETNNLKMKLVEQRSLSNNTFKPKINKNSDQIISLNENRNLENQRDKS